jgi:hypothetical protein
MSQILKPKHLSTYVPGFGVINKADFSNEHLEACVKQVKDTGGDVDAYLKSRFEVAISIDVPLLEQISEPKPKSKGKKKAAEPQAPDDEAELQRLIAEEEKAKKTEG